MGYALILGAGFVLGSILLVFAGYFIMRTIMGTAEEETRDLAGSMIFRVSALHGLILALVFAQAMVEYRDLKSETIAEAEAAADIFYDLDRHGSAPPELRTEVMRYVELVVTQEWDRLGRGQTLSDEAWTAWNNVYEGVLDLPADSPRENALRSQMLADIDDISQARDLRLSHLGSPLTGLFWTAALVGVVVVSLSYFSYAPTARHLLLLSFFAGYVGLVMFLIYALSNPFAPPGALPPTALERVLDDMARSQTS